jgi:hypothetical protein
MRPHEKLDVWMKSVDLVVRIYKATESFPKEEKFGFDLAGETSGCFGTRKYCRRSWASI